MFEQSFVFTARRAVLVTAAGQSVFSGGGYALWLKFHEGHL
jgi:hypothetical protein